MLYCVIYSQLLVITYYRARVQAEFVTHSSHYLVSLASYYQFVHRLFCCFVAKIKLPAFWRSSSLSPSTLTCVVSVFRKRIIIIILKSSSSSTSTLTHAGPFQLPGVTERGEVPLSSFILPTNNDIGQQRWSAMYCIVLYCS